MHPRNETPPIFLLLASGMRALAHSIRGDLSVLTNDLSYLSTMTPPGETDRLKARCQSIASTLQATGVFGGGGPSPKPVTLGELCRDIGVGVAAEPWIEGSVNIDAALFGRALRAVLPVVGTLLEAGTGWRAEGQVSGVEAWTLTFLGELAKEELGGVWSLGGFVGARFGERVVPQVVFGELALLCQGVTTSVKILCQKTLVIETVFNGADK